VLPGTARTHTFSGLDLPKNELYSLDIFAFSGDITGADAPAVFNIASARIDFVPGVGIRQPRTRPSVPPIDPWPPELPPPSRPPGPETWPAYPDFPRTSCYAAATDAGKPMRFAPSRLPAAPAATTPQAILHKVMTGMGRGSLVRGGSFGAVPSSARHVHGRSRAAPQLRTGLRLTLDAPLAARFSSAAGANMTVRRLRAAWEANLVAGAVRDLLCWNRERPVVDWDVTPSRPKNPGYEQRLAFGQWFPNPGAATFRGRVALAAKALDLRVVSVELLRPLQLAPAVVLEARDREAFVARIPQLLQYLNPSPRTGAGATFEGLFVQGVDRSGKPFAAAFSNRRGTVRSGSWTLTGVRASRRG
jgi:hypothetical protein